MFGTITYSSLKVDHTCPTPALSLVLDRRDHFTDNIYLSVKLTVGKSNISMRAHRLCDIVEDPILILKQTTGHYSMLLYDKLWLKVQHDIKEQQ